MSINCYIDPYQEFAQASIKRKQFNKLKQTPAFKMWYNRQLKVQENLCAWCQEALQDKKYAVHVDHVTPLRFDGKNKFENFVISCAKCNMKKWIANNYVTPQWIKDNDNKMRERQRLNSRRQAQFKQAKELNDEIVAEMIAWI